MKTANSVDMLAMPMSLLGKGNAKNFMNTILSYAAMGTALGAANLGVGQASKLIGSLSQKAKVAPLYEKMIQIHPKLKSYNQERVKLYYDQLWHFSPKVAENPLAAGNYIYYAMQYDTDAGGPGITAFKELADIEQKSNSVKAIKGIDTGTALMRASQLLNRAEEDIYSTPYEKLKKIDEFSSMQNPRGIEDVSLTPSGRINSYFFKGNRYA